MHVIIHSLDNFNVRLFVHFQFGSMYIAYHHTGVNLNTYLLMLGTQVKMRKKRPKFRSAQTQTDPKM